MSSNWFIIREKEDNAMGWGGAGIGAAIGAVLGGPIGAGGGAAIGHFFSEDEDDEKISISCPHCKETVVIDSESV